MLQALHELQELQELQGDFHVSKYQRFEDDRGAGSSRDELANDLGYQHVVAQVRGMPVLWCLWG